MHYTNTFYCIINKILVRLLIMEHQAIINTFCDHKPITADWVFTPRDDKLLTADWVFTPRDDKLLTADCQFIQNYFHNFSVKKIIT